MKCIYKKENIYLVRVDRGEELVEKIVEFCQKENINGAWVEGLGAGDKVELSWYDLNKKEYIKKVFEEPFEIVNLSGNIALADKKPLLHAHVTLTNTNFQSFGGHLHSLRISGTGEIKITNFNKIISRAMDYNTGLKLLKK